MAVEFKNLPPKEAVAFFKKKGYALGFDWRDVWQQEHAAAFTVAKVSRLDVLEDIRGAMDTAIKNGVTAAQFKKNLKPILQAKGWWGKRAMYDPVEKKFKRAQLGSSRRLQTIFDTNMRTAYAAGKWERAERTKKTRPYLRYIAVRDSRTRPQHSAWHGTVLPIDHEFWQSHFPPNGWRCRCTVQTLSERDLKRYGRKISPDPPVQTRKYLNKRTGEVTDVPVGIDPGFSYNVGEARDRALTPPPTGGLPTSFPAGVNLPPLPAPRPAPAKLLPKGLSDDEYIDSFLGEFGVKRGQAMHFTDKAGERLVISEELFRTSENTLKLTRASRQRYLLLTAAAIKNPDEIWWIWEKLKNKPGLVLRRRHIARWDMGDGQALAVSVFEHGKDGWMGITSFAPYHNRSKAAQDRYMNKQRGELLAWRRKDPPK